jgi:hypothetical protein
MSDQVREALHGIMDKAFEAVRGDSDLRRRLSVVAKYLLAFAAEGDSEADSPRPEQALVETAEPPSGGTESGRALPHAADLTGWLPDDLGADATALVPASGVGLGPDIDVPKLIDHLWLKAEAARWAAERQRLLAGHTDIHLEVAPHDRAFLTRAKAEGCYVWMLHPRYRSTASADDFDLIAANFETTAEAVALAQSILTKVAEPHEVKEALTLLAEAQSALRFAIAGCDGYADDDQQRLFTALREIADERRIYIATGLKLNDPVDPSEWAAIAGRIEDLRQRVAERQQAERRKTKLLNNLKYKASQVAGESDPDAWKGIVPVIDQLAEAGVQPSRIEIREALLPIADRLPPQAGESKAFGLVLREIERFRSQPVPPTAATSESPTEDVQKVAKLLSGKSLVLIGAEGRREATEAIERTFGLSRVEWIATSEHESYRGFEPFIARSDVAAVLLLIRWSSHSFGEVKAICDRHGKPLVRLPGGYNPNQIAAAILSQASDRLSRN